MIRFRVSPEERAAIQAAADADGMAVGAWLGTSAMAWIRRRVTPGQLAEGRERLAELEALRAAIAPAGNNLNQITEKVHTGEAVGLDYAHEVLEVHREVVEQLDQLRKSYRTWLRR